MSTFSGIGAASISWNPGIYEFVAYAEPAAFPAHVLHYRRGAGRPRYMPNPEEPGISEKERKRRRFNIKNVPHLPETGTVNFGDITQITDDDLRTLGTVHVLEGGSPCQAFSVAGARKGLEDPRGNLMLTFCQLAERMREINGLEFVVWENVHGVLSEDKTNAFGCLLASLAGETGGALEPPGEGWSNAGRVFGPGKREVAWRTVEASYWGIPQRRKRVFVVANIGGTIRRFGAPDEVLFEFGGSHWNLKKGLETRQAVVSTYRRGDRLEYRSAKERLQDPEVIARLDAEASREWIGAGLAGRGASFAIDMKSQPYASEHAYALTARNAGNPQAVTYALADDYDPKASKDKAFALMAGSPTGGGHKQMVVHQRSAGIRRASGADTGQPAGNAAETDLAIVRDSATRSAPIVLGVQVSGTLNAREGRPKGVSSEYNFVMITAESQEASPEDWIVRHFTPLECERLQGFPDYWTDVPFRGKLVADGHRYGAIGNSMPCPVMAFIGDHLEMEMYFLGSAKADPESLRRKRGRPSKGTRAMTAAERQRRHRERLHLEAGLPAAPNKLDHETALELLGQTQELRRLLGTPSLEILERLDILEAMILDLKYGQYRRHHICGEPPGAVGETAAEPDPELDR